MSHPNNQSMPRPHNQKFAEPSLAPRIYTRGDYMISTDSARLDVDAIHAYLSRSYWANLRPREIIDISLRHSLNFGVYHITPQGSTQVGLARIVTDYAIFAYLCDVYVLEEHRGHGLGKWLIDTMIADPALKHVVRIMLATRDAHGLYAQFGFAPAKPEIWMERIRSA
jgi:GNAT superfamily N-acetyltransferase